MAFPDPVIWAIPFFLVTLALEAWWLKRGRGRAPKWKDSAASLSLGLGSLVAGALTAGLVLALMKALYAHRLIDIPVTWWSFALCFVADDFGYYLFHRSAHRVRWFWASHVVHHSSERYNLATALRQTWTGFVSLNFLFRVPLCLIGFAPELVLFCAGLNLVYQYWIHTEAIGRMPRWFEAVMNTPSHHRVHHAVNPRYLDRNYAGVFIVWDRMLGTFEPERSDDAPRYGIVTPLRSHNPLWAATHEWVGMARDFRSAPLRAKLGYLWREPGWSHDGSRDTSDTIRARWRGAEEGKPQ
ncbi:sterol desaturase family protein [Sphingomonas rosea]|uniref:Sterol desaturase family protein n=1 Tax=Sphingomonas rosea TaxID=335605 RepID=A0ABP7TTY1_9SPHN